MAGSLSSLSRSTVSADSLVGEVILVLGESERSHPMI